MIAFAWIALFSWPLIAIILYRKLRLPVALCVTFIGAHLLLPSGLTLDLPLLPPLDRESMTTLTALVLTAFALGRKNQSAAVLPGRIPRGRIVQILMLILLTGIVGTVATNRDTLVYGDRVLRGISPYDGLSGMIATFLLIAPLFLARRVLASREGQRVLLVTLVVSALAYSVPALYEVRMSPQLHTIVYGYFPHQFAQAMRGGGFRPIVFTNHGLTLAIYWTFAMIAAVGLFRAAKNPVWDPNRALWGISVIWLAMMLVLSKTMGAALLALVLVPVALFCTPRIQLLIAASISAAILLYPILRAASLVPIDQLMALAESVSADRARSLDVRLFNEDLLLEKAQERPLFGWGSWGRNRVFNEFGRDMTVTDGAWISFLGEGGWFRYLGIFGLLCWPIIGLFLKQRKHIDPICSALVLILCAKIIDLLPNAGLSWPFIWLIVGSLIGRLEMRVGVAQTAAASPEPSSGGKPGYARAPAAWKNTVVSSEGPVYARSFRRQDETLSAPLQEKETRRHDGYKRAKALARHRR